MRKMFGQIGRRRFSAVMGVLAVSALADSGMLHADEMELVKSGVPKAVIVLPENPEKNETLAAKELTDYIRKISGAELKTLKGDSPIPSGMVPVRIGLVLSPDAEKAIRAKTNDPAAFRIQSSKEGISLAGLTPEATLFAAYEFLNLLGVDWFVPGEIGEEIKVSPNLAVKQQDAVHFPTFTGRHLQAVGDMKWAKRMKLGGLDAGAHGLPFKADRKKEPELFCVENGNITHQLDVSNPEVLKRTVAGSLEYLKKTPGKKYVPMSPEDGPGFGVSKWDVDDMDPLHGKISVTDRYIKFFNLVLAEIKKEYPDAGIAFYCYGQLMRPPVREKPDKDLLVIFAPIDLCRFHSIDNPICPERAYMKELIQGWQKFGCKIFYRGYYFNLADQGFPFTMQRQITDEIALFRDAGFVGCRVECMPLWGSHAPSLYLAARLMWDANSDPKAIQEKFFTGFYGPAAIPMRKYFEVLEDAYEKADYHTGNVFDIPHILTPALMKELDTILGQAEKCVPKGSSYAERIGIVRMAQEYGKVNLAMIAAFNECDLLKAREEYLKAKAILKEGNKRNPPLVSQTPTRYLERFWGNAITAAAEKMDRGNQIVARLPDEWLFIIDPLNGGESLGFFKPGMGQGNWTKIKTCSSSWSNQGLRYYKGECWYRTTVKVDEKFKGRKINLWLGGVDDLADAWINGTKLPLIVKGAPPCGKAWEFDASDALKFGTDNVVVVKVTNREVNELGTGGLTGPAMLWTDASRSEDVKK